MFDQGTPHKTRRGHGLIIAAALAAFTLTAVGMVAAIRSVDDPAVAASATAPAAAASSDVAASGPHAQHASAASATADASAALDAPKNVSDADAPAYRPAAVQVIDWDMTEKLVEIAPGKVVKVWTFDDKVPGPVVRVRVGDLVRVTIRNKTKMPHSIDFHAARIAPNKAFRDVAPGESFTFEFRATTPGVFMYHCGTAPVVHHLANGMYGMIIVEPEGGLPKVDRELALVQSDFYVSDTPGMPADDAKVMTGIPDVVAFNGYAAQYKDAPITVKKGEEIRVFLLAAGPNTWSAFHVVGTIFDRAWIDGIHPENLSIGNQTLNLSASQGAVAELHLDEEGIYPFVTHDFTNATKGAVGLLKTEHATGTMSH
jgi:nitrite reductase (NO-forming)